MIDGGALQEFRRRVESELEEDILPFWLEHAVDEEYGGFRGRISNTLQIDPHAEKGLILNARILWTFSHAYDVYGDAIYLKTAERAYDYLLHRFWDREYGGFYWMVDHRGSPLVTTKKIYGQAFGIYALAEYFRSTRREDSMQRAVQLYELIERASHDGKRGGYFETYDRDWSLAADQRLSSVDLDEKRSMNTHLHVLEALAALLGARSADRIRERLSELIRIFLDRILDPRTFHFRMFFDEEWHPRSDRISFGHDIEGSWLLCEAAEKLGDAAIRTRVEEAAEKMADAVLAQAIDTDGGLLYEAGPEGIIDDDKHWWPQAEAVVGFLNAYQIGSQERFFEASRNTWGFIENRIVDRKHGEWFWKVSRAGIPGDDKFKVDPWKCPYHNSRTCFEVMERLDRIAAKIVS
jgi:mannobiose 2-epimerase